MQIKYNIKKFICMAARPVYKILRDYLPGEIFYQNIGYNPIEKQKRVLISYITYSFEHDYRERIGHTSYLELPIIINTFLGKNCVVDVIKCSNKNDIPTVLGKKYDYIFGFGHPWKVAVENNPEATAVMYLTECAPKYSTEREQERMDYFAARHGKSLPLTRSNVYFLDEHIAKACVGGFFGNKHTAEAFIRQFPQMELKLLSPSGFKNQSINTCPPPGDRCSFLWFGSWGAIHKGLDILLDVFKNIPEAKLYVAGLNGCDKWLIDDYKKCSNIVDVGFLDVQSHDFLELVQKVHFCIMPSASEGMSTSVLTCMRHGMIPVITPSCGIDVDDFGYLIEDYHVEQVAELVKKLITLPDSEIIRRRQATYDEANRRYSLEAFAKGMKDFVDSFVD